MNDRQRAESDLRNIINIYLLMGPHDSWNHFWKTFYSQRIGNQQKNIDEFINSQTKDISQILLLLGKDNSDVKEFLSVLPLRFSRAILSWPNPTAEEIHLLMTD